MSDYSITNPVRATGTSIVYYEGPREGKYSPPTYSSRAEFLWDRIGGCGCGHSDTFADLVLAVLREAEAEFDDRTFRVADDQRMQILAHWLTSLGYLEHGTSVDYNWLTEKGKQLLREMEALEEVHEN